MTGARASLLPRAKVRAARRASEGGGIIFIVALTLSVLAAVGAYALQSAATEVRTSGYERQSMQSHYLSEFGAFAALYDMSPGLGPAFVTHAYCAADTCTSVPAPSGASPIGKTCARIETVVGTSGPVNEVTHQFGVDTPVIPYDPATGNSGSLGTGTASAWTAGDFWVEFSDPSSQVMQQSGYSQGPGAPQSIKMTLTSAGITQLQLASGASTNPAATWGSEGIELQRVRVTVGPMRLPRCQPKQ